MASLADGWLRAVRRGDIVSEATASAPVSKSEEPIPMTDLSSAAVATRSPEPTLISYTHWMYALHALSALIGLSSAAFVATAFVFGLPSIIAIIMNYLKRGESSGTWLESHFAWQRRTFWFALLWVAIVSILSLPLFLILVGFFTFGVGIALIGLWVIYRVARGWLRLRDGQPI